MWTLGQTQETLQGIRLPVGYQRTFYHATVAGQDDAVLQSFIRKGAHPDYFSDGHGQGKGFYLWSSLELANRHATEFLSSSNDAAASGRPIVVAVTLPICSSSLLPDFEVHTSKIVEALYQFRDQMIGQSFEIDARTTGKILLYEPEAATSQSLRLRYSIEQAGASRVKFDSIYSGANEYRDTGAAAILSRIVEQVPGLKGKFESWVQQILETPGEFAALKYTGKDPVPVIGIYEVGK